ncbi:unnamed protein product, partial [Brassica rapa]
IDKVSSDKPKTLNEAILIKPTTLQPQQQLKPISIKTQPAHQSSPTDTLLCDKDRAREEKRKGKQIMTSPCGPELYNPFSALGSLGEEG